MYGKENDQFQWKIPMEIPMEFDSGVNRKLIDMFLTF